MARDSFTFKKNTAYIFTSHFRCDENDKLMCLLEPEYPSKLIDPGSQS